MKKKKYLRAGLFSIIMVVLQVAVDIMRHTAINWVEVLVGAGIVFVISIGSKSSIEVKNKKQKNQADKNKTQNNKEISNSSANKNRNEKGSEINDLSFYSYNRIAIVSMVIGIGCIVYGRMGEMENVFWLYMVSILCFVQAIVFFVLYSKKRREFIEKSQITHKNKK